MRLYPTEDASARLREHGIKHSPTYLRKLRSLGKGPRFVLFNNRPYYTGETLDEYVEANTSAPARSGVEHTKAGHRQRRCRDVDVDVAAEPAAALPSPRTRRPETAEAASVE
jgi:hypothetical protein